MSTIKSSTEHLTLNADGVGKDIKFQANGVEKASISSAGVMTATSFAGDGSALTGVGKVLQSKIISDASYTSSSSTGFVTVATITITNVATSSQVHIDASINHLIEANTIGTFAIFKGTTLLAQSIHNTYGSTWRQPLNTFIAVDATPTAGTNTYTVKMKSSAGLTIYYNYNGSQGAYSYYRLMEIGV